MAPTPTAIDWQAVIQAIAQLLLPLGIAELRRLEATVTNPVELAAIKAAIQILTTLEPAPAPLPAGRRFGRGLNPTPRHRLVAATPYRPTVAHLNAVPATFLTLPSVMSVLGNDRYGDCVSAEEGASKMAYSIWGQAGKAPAITITDQTVIDWATRHGVRNGADLEPVIEWMQQTGMTATDGHTYCDGSPSAVDYTDDAALRAAIVQGPVKIGVAANQLEHAVNSTNGKTGWVLAGGYHDGNEDHCVGLWGFGAIGDLESAVRAAGFPVAVPFGVNPSTPAYALYTWATVGILDRQSLLNITGEAWLRTPTTVGVTPPAPTPQPTPGPAPVPVPPAPPTPAGYTGSFTVDTGLFGRKTLTFSNGELISVQ